MAFKDLRTKWVKAKADGEALCKKKGIKPPDFPKNDLGPLVESLDGALSDATKKVEEAEKAFEAMVSKINKALDAANGYAKVLATVKDSQLVGIYIPAMSKISSTLGLFEIEAKRRITALQKLKDSTVKLS